ncbi:MAG: hypothetical protein K5905_30875, partial [Roseibium sp.]|uniref:hypothetical protein n=1 Tax=Roseibium sp. TaxID=1936156 RepID=UPI00260905EA
MYLKAHLARMRRLLVSSVLILTLISVPAASQSKLPANMPLASEIAAQLELTADQEIVFVAIVENHVARTMTLLEKHGVDPSKGRPSLLTMRAMRKDMEQNR